GAAQRGRESVGLGDGSESERRRAFGRLAEGEVVGADALVRVDQRAQLDAPDDSGHGEPFDTLLGVRQTLRARPPPHPLSYRARVLPEPAGQALVDHDDL